MLNEAPVAAVPLFVIVDENACGVPAVAAVGVITPGVRSGEEVFTQSI